MTRLITFGCSNTFGQALPDVWDYEKNEEILNSGPSKYAWPQILADKLNLECVNLGLPGASNKEVWFHIVNTEFKKSDIVIILWPVKLRWCIIEDPVPYTGEVVQIGPFNRRRKHPPSIAFFKYIYNEQDHIIDYFMRVNYVSMLLKNKVKILKHYETEITEPYNYPKWFDSNIEKVNFVQDILDIYPKAMDNGHPGEEGNKAFADILYKDLC